jgi:hypothetical protein
MRFAAMTGSMFAAHGLASPAPMSGMVGGVVVDRIAMRIIGRSKIEAGGAASEIECESCMRATVG